MGAVRMGAAPMGQCRTVPTGAAPVGGRAQPMPAYSAAVTVAQSASKAASLPPVRA